jgi:hypothetical protein
MLAAITLIAIMATLARLAGGGLFADRIHKRLPEILFALPFGYVLVMHTGNMYWGLAAWIWSYLWMETGHGTAFHMGYKPEVARTRKQALSRIIDPICAYLGYPLGGKLYCWLFMGLKGALIGLPAAPAGLLLGLLWPFGYWLGRLLGNRHGAIEWISGGFAGLVIYLSA